MDFHFNLFKIKEHYSFDVGRYIDNNWGKKHI